VKKDVSQRSEVSTLCLFRHFTHLESLFLVTLDLAKFLLAPSLCFSSLFEALTGPYLSEWNVFFTRLYFQF
jgi:hypothetical protein